ncbi:DUF58 domain-containing protein [Galbibacter pacificus]|uniref:DUF58 domain-containing protein n=1 Tax=Galbibacter pacificus TaxID=2996052 RepID=A0ABT6FTN0_9FLAO|nr:DUF58 domain-containing protein [Galbibacter pacificus]MDG3582436.1 DUF58 domain-containing protein [Galbibacter pacificus]MDG3586446.1 DUF58 domain-containing protein [Galbibacter pacificus]
MDLQTEINNLQLPDNLELVANQVVEGFISGMHKSPFHGFSSEFAEHKIYNQGESTRHIDWKLFAKTDKLYTKKYDEETNLRCHIIIDNSASMHYPDIKKQSINKLNKLGFSVLAATALIKLLKKQRDAVGLSVYADTYEFYAPEKGSERHMHLLFNTLEGLLTKNNNAQQTKTYTYLHQIAEKIHRRSLIFLFTDMFQTETDHDALFQALQHLKYNKHEVVLFHVLDKEKEFDFNFDNAPKRFKDIETGEIIDLFAENIKDAYKDSMEKYQSAIKLRCAQYKINYVIADVQKDIGKILQTYLIERQRFA